MLVVWKPFRGIRLQHQAFLGELVVLLFLSHNVPLKVKDYDPANYMCLIRLTWFKLESSISAAASCFVPYKINSLGIFQTSYPLQKLIV